MKWISLGILFALATHAGAASPTSFTIDSTRSRVTLTLSLQGKEDTEHSPLSGFMDLDFLPGVSPQSPTLVNYRINTTQVIAFQLVYSFLGKIDASLNSLSLVPPGIPPSPVVGSLVSTNLTFTNLLSYARGGGQYVATGIPCTFLKSIGRECTDTFDFDDEAPQQIAEMSGTLRQVGNQMELSIRYPVSQPLDSQAPDLGSVTGVAVIVATAEVPQVAPVLAVAEAAGDEIELSWPEAYPLYKLQQTTLVSAAKWVDVTTAPVLEQGRYKIRIPVDQLASQRFFRLTL